MDDLIAFLRARLDETEQDSRALLTREGQSLVVLRLARERLAEVEAKRRLIDAIVALKRPTRQQISAPQGARPGTWNPARPIGPDPREPLLRLLAQRHAEHPDYRPEWRS